MVSHHYFIKDLIFFFLNKKAILLQKNAKKMNWNPF